MVANDCSFGLSLPRQLRKKSFPSPLLLAISITSNLVERGRLVKPNIIRSSLLLWISNSEQHKATLLHSTILFLRISYVLCFPFLFDILTKDDIHHVCTFPNKFGIHLQAEWAICIGAYALCWSQAYTDASGRSLNLLIGHASYWITIPNIGCNSCQRTRMMMVGCCVVFMISPYSVQIH